jgi:oligogalacturonide transporter
MNDLNGGAWGTLTGSYLMFFMTTYGHLSPLEVGGMFFTCKMLDIAVCAIIGGVSDNLFKFKLGRKFGRRHTLLLVGAAMVVVGFPLLFQTSPGGYWWYFIVYFLIDSANAFIGIAYETLPTEMTPKADERVKLSSVRLFISAFSTFAVTALPALLLSILPDDGSGHGTAEAYTISGIVFGVVFAGGTLITYFTTWEFSPTYVAEFEGSQASVEREHKGKRSNLLLALKEYWHVWKTKSCRRIFTIYFVSYFAKDCYATAFLYFVVFVLGATQAHGQAVLSLSFIGMIVVPIATVLMFKRGPKFLWTSAYSIMLLVLGVFGILYAVHENIETDGIHSIVLLFVLGISWQVGRQIMEYTPWNVIPFVPDVDTLVSTKLRAGTFAAVQTFTRRATGALGTAFIGFVLEFGGFQSTATEQTVNAKHSIALVFIVIPFILICWCMYLIRTFNLDQRTHGIIKAEIDRLQAAGADVASAKAAVDPETKAVAEDLTGYKYEELWDSTK